VVRGNAEGPERRVGHWQDVAQRLDRAVAGDRVGVFPRQFPLGGGFGKDAATGMIHLINAGCK
jgi:hypothetical protein